MGLYGFMAGETPQPGVADLPAEDVQLVRETLAAMLAGEFTRFDVFAGPIEDNQGNVIRGEGVRLLRATLAALLAGAFTRFDVFAGPIKDNQGNVMLAEGERLVQSDLDQFPPGAPGAECSVCMKWWAEGISGELPQ